MPPDLRSRAASDSLLTRQRAAADFAFQREPPTGDTNPEVRAASATGCLPVHGVPLEVVFVKHEPLVNLPLEFFLAIEFVTFFCVVDRTRDRWHPPPDVVSILFRGPAGSMSAAFQFSVMSLLPPHRIDTSMARLHRAIDSTSTQKSAAGGRLFIRALNAVDSCIT